MDGLDTSTGKNTLRVNIAGIIPECVVNGPGGISYTIFAQGCAHKCSGCHNPETHDFDAGEVWTIEQLLADIEKYPLSKRVTLTGGDPFFQPEGFYHLARALKRKQYTLIAYSGFYFEDLCANSRHKKLLKQVDILIDGPFIQAQKRRWLNFRGSMNQRILDVHASLSRDLPVHLPKYYAENSEKMKSPNHK